MGYHTLHIDNTLLGVGAKSEMASDSLAIETPESQSHEGVSSSAVQQAIAGFLCSFFQLSVRRQRDMDQARGSKTREPSTYDTIPKKAGWVIFSGKSGLCKPFLSKGRRIISVNPFYQRD